MAARDIFRNGLDAQNPALVQLLGLCPLLAVSTSAGSALGLGLATLAVLVTSNLIASVLGRWLLPEIRLAVFVLTIAGAVTAVELSLAAWWPGLHDSLGIFLPLIVTNCLVLARAEAFASRQPIRRRAARRAWRWGSASCWCCWHSAAHGNCSAAAASARTSACCSEETRPGRASRSSPPGMACCWRCCHRERSCCSG